VPSHPKLVTSGQVCLNAKRAISEFRHSAAFQAEQVVMVVSPGLKPGPAIAEIDPANYPQPGQQVQVAINCN
jgi:hypothetical protein